MKNKEAIKWVLLTILGGILCEFCVKPIVGIIGSYTDTILGAFINYYYYRCATSNISDILSQVALIVIFAFYIYPVADSMHTLNKVKNYNKDLIEIENKIVETHTSKLDKDDNTEQKLENIQKEIEWSKKRIKTLSVLHKTTIFLVVISFINSIAFTIYPYMLRTEFDETLIKITPYVERTKVDMLKSDWTRMRNYEDYKKIEDFVENVIERNSLR